MPTSPLTLDSLPGLSTSQILNASSLTLNLPQPPKNFYRHGWQSWSLAAWLDPSEPPLPIRSPQFRAKDEDPAYAFHENHVSAWVGAVELGEDDILLLGALGLGGRVEMDGRTLKGFYENTGQHDILPVGQDNISPYEWLLARGTETEVFSKYAELLEGNFGKTLFEKPPRVWCSWYSLYKWINERVLLKTLHGIGDLPFDVFQIDDGWQLAYGDWIPNQKFPSGMQALADKIKVTGHTAGLWLAPFMVASNSQAAREHPNWILRRESGQPVPAGITWGNTSLALDVSHPAVLEWLDDLIRRVRGWGYDYLKLDFLYLGAVPGKRHKNVPREEAYRHALQVMREAAGDAYLLACGAPIIPSLGLCDGIRVGPDVAPYWLNRPMSVWLNNPNDPAVQNGIRTSLHRLWLKPLVHVDPDVVYFRSRFNTLTPEERQLLQDLGTITGFKATSDLPGWLKPSEWEKLRDFLSAAPTVRQVRRYEYQIDGRGVDFNPVIPMEFTRRNIPVWLAEGSGFLKIGARMVLPAILASLR